MKTSRYVGVYWHARESRWRSQVKDRGRNLHLGSYRVESDAAAIHDEARRLLGREAVNLPEMTDYLVRSLARRHLARQGAAPLRRPVTMVRTLIRTMGMLDSEMVATAPRLAA